MKENKCPAKAADLMPSTASTKATKQKQVCPDYPLLDNWLIELETLLTKYPHLNIGNDISSMTLIELRGVFMLLSRIND